MAAPSYTLTGAITSAPTINVSYAVQTASVPPVQTAFLQSVTGSPIAALTYSAGTGAAQINKVFVASGSVTTGGTATINVATGLDVSGTTASIAHIRELWIFNDGLTTGFLTSTDAAILVWDTSTTATAFGYGAAGTGPIETGTKIDIPCGSSIRLAKPYGSAGWTVGSTNQIVLSGITTNTAAVNYRVIVAGD